MKEIVSRSTLTRLSALAFGASLVSVAPAQSFFLRPLPDYDQRRDDLPGDGKMWCVPTSYADVLKFMASVGLTGMDANFGNSYADITSFLDRLGDEMGTTASGGTGFKASFDAMSDWIDDHTGTDVLQFKYGVNSGFNADTIKFHLITGGLIRLGYGKYQMENGVFKRKGGHAVAIAGYDWRNGKRDLLVSDPWSSDGDLNAQGSFTHDRRQVTLFPANLHDKGLRYLLRYTDWSGDDGKWARFIDSLHVVQPLWAGWVDAPETMRMRFKGDKPAGVTFRVAFARQFDDSTNRLPREFSVDLPGPVRDWCVDHGGVAIYALGEDDVVRHVNLVSKEVKTVGRMPGARKLAVAGADLDLYVLQDGTSDDKLVKIRRLDNRRTTLSVPKGITEIQPDPSTRGIAALHPVQRKLFSIDEGLRSARPRTIELPEGTGAAMFSIDRQGEVVVARNGVRSVLRPSGRRFSLAFTPRLRAIQSVGKNAFAVQDGDRIVLMDEDGKPVRSAFSGLKVTGKVRFAQSWDAIRWEDSTGPGWQDSPPEEP